MRVYLDNSSLNRLSDDPSQERVRVECEIINDLLVGCADDRWQVVGSSTTLAEINATPDTKRRTELWLLTSFIEEWIEITPKIDRLARRWEGMGLRPADALHLAAAEQGDVDYFVTCDDRLLRWSRRHPSELSVRVVLPTEWRERQ